MARFKRSTYLFFYLQDGRFLDIVALFKGDINLTPVKQVLAISIPAAREYPITLEQLQTLFHVPADRWIGASELPPPLQGEQDMLEQFIAAGLVLSDDEAGLAAEFRRRDELLASTQWNIYAALYHFMSRWQDIHLKIDLPSNIQELGEVNAASEDVFREFVEHYGLPPSHFHSPSPTSSVVYDLPLVKREHPLYTLLSQRKTTRAFDANRSMSLEELSTVLYWVYGSHGYSPVYKDIVGLKKTSPSGGCLHPTEVYPLVINVQDVPSGLYHYSVKDNSLKLVHSLSIKEASELANEFTAGQSYPRWAHALFIMTSRFYRNFWKYRKHDKAYNVLNMDVAHLSQTFYLVCAELGLGAFVTAAINSVNIENKLGLDGFSEGALAICGCGIPLSNNFNLDPEYLPYVPRQTNI